MNINVNIPKFKSIRTERAKLDPIVLEEKLTQLVNELENDSFLDTDLYESIVSLGVNREELDKMISELKNYSSYGETSSKDGVNFQWKNWLERLTTKSII